MNRIYRMEKTRFGKEPLPHVMDSDNPNFERYVIVINHKHNYNT